MTGNKRPFNRFIILMVMGVLCLCVFIPSYVRAEMADGDGNKEEYTGEGSANDEDEEPGDGEEDESENAGEEEPEISEDTSAPVIVLTPDSPNEYGLYNGDVQIKIVVYEGEEPVSGLKSIEYRITDGSENDMSAPILLWETEDEDTGKADENTDEGDLKEAGNAKEQGESEGEAGETESGESSQTVLTRSWTGSITVDSDIYHGCDVRVYVHAADNAGNVSTETLEPDIDITSPVITVSYDNNAVSQGKYFSSGRTATVTVKEEHFSEKRVVFTQTASYGSASAEAPQAVWYSDGDVHTAVINYTEDGDYTLGISVTDMAGNTDDGVDYGSSEAPFSFTIDTGIAKPVFTGAENGKSYKGTVNINAVFSDINLDCYDISLSRTRMDEADLDVTEQFVAIDSEDRQKAVASVGDFDRIRENDGIYTLTAEVSDRAGNTESETMVFTVNRYGSVYALNQTLTDLKGTCVQAVDGDPVITEYNPDRLVAGSLQVELIKDGAPVNDVVYSVDPVINEYVSVGERGWYQYEYSIDRTNFSDDGIYSLAVSSEDEAGNFPETANYEDCQIEFMVDSTPAELTAVSGLDDVRRGESVKVTFELFDGIGLKEAYVYLDGKPAISYTGESIQWKTVYSGGFTLDADMNVSTVGFVVTDMAGNIMKEERDVTYAASGAGGLTEKIREYAGNLFGRNSNGTPGTGSGLFGMNAGADSLSETGDIAEMVIIIALAAAALVLTGVRCVRRRKLK